eukprot:gnl/TRDRNA2_/TRDRNA2_184511_c0_seq1.p1 gnl/TRDRNA2_/TRDRNA2_184511_c0~~gnl/TRDRNA2_/TRDRNA2_184511_c0_seq1.p1  ORF type:complete len:503 (+),score=138.11 gnl/TRDRNA2_/TRDRNA2_184511_c0_seq1:54-1562(+)
MAPCPWQTVWALLLVTAAPALALDQHEQGSLRSAKIVSAGQRALSQLRRAGKGKKAKDDFPYCSCDCCDTVLRRADEVVDGAGVKCVPSELHNSDMCTDQCVLDSTEHVLDTQEDDALEYGRFCFFECKPAHGIFSPVTDACVALDSADMQKTRDAEGNAQDPALVYAKKRSPPVASLIRQTAAVMSSKEPTAKDAKFSVLKGTKWSETEGSQARAEASANRQIEASKAQDLQNSLRFKYGDAAPQQFWAGQPPVNAVGPTSQFNLLAAQTNSELAAPRMMQAPGDSETGETVVDPFAAVADIRASALGTKAASEKASDAAADAFKAYQQARIQNWKVAVEASKQQMYAAKEQAIAKAQAEHEALMASKNSNEVKAAAAAEKAAWPYFVGMLRAQQSAKDYTKKGGATAAAARALDRKAKGLKAEADQDNLSGKRDAAEEKILNARNVAQQAQTLSKQASGMFTTADMITKSIPTYVTAAQAAAAKAAYDSNPAWNPGKNTR